MNIPNRPLLESYWVEPGRLLAGEYPGSAIELEVHRRLSALLVAGFDTFFDLTRPGELEPYHAILAEESSLLGCPAAYRRFPIGDFGLPSREQMTAILDAIDAALEAGHKVYLHCWGGVGRTGTVVGCYLVRRGLSGDQALRQLAAWWRRVPKSIRYPRSPETDAQVHFIREWSEGSGTG